MKAAHVSGAQASELVAWEYRVKDIHPDTVTTGQWFAWERVGLGCRVSLEDAKHYATTRPEQYELRALYAVPYGVTVPYHHTVRTPHVDDSES